MSEIEKSMVAAHKELCSLTFLLVISIIKKRVVSRSAILNRTDKVQNALNRLKLLLSTD